MTFLLFWDILFLKFQYPHYECNPVCLLCVYVYAVSGYTIRYTFRVLGTTPFRLQNHPKGGWDLCSGNPVCTPLLHRAVISPALAVIS